MLQRNIYYGYHLVPSGIICVAVAGTLETFVPQPAICCHLTPSAASPESGLELPHVCGATRFPIEVGARLVNGAIVHFCGNWPE